MSNDLAEALDEVLEDIGVEVDVFVSGVNAGRVWVMVEPIPGQDVAKITLPHDFRWSDGAVLTVRATGEEFIVAAMVSPTFENKVFRKDATGFRVNSDFSAYEISTERVNYQPSVVETEVVAAGKGFLASSAVNLGIRFGSIQVDRGEMFVPAGYGIKVGHRISVVGGMVHEVVGDRRFSSGVRILTLQEDTRG